ncbi:MAG: CbtA family protein [Devosia sp.]
MARSFLIRGMLCGIVGGLLMFLFAKFFGEPSVDAAIGIEEQIAKAAGDAPEPVLVSRALQAGWGLLTGAIPYSIAVGGLFSLVFAFCWGRMGRLGARASSALIAGASLVTIYLVPNLKYPANPPSVGNPETIGYRTYLYFGMIIISIAAMVAAINLGKSLVGRFDKWHSTIIAGAVYLAVISIAFAVMPNIDEVPKQFPATLLWQFRLSALGMQLILWTTLGLLFGELTERSMARSGPRQSALRRV